MDEILKCDHSNEIYRGVLSCGAIWFAAERASNLGTLLPQSRWKLLVRTILWCSDYLSPSHIAGCRTLPLRRHPCCFVIVVFYFLPLFIPGKEEIGIEEYSFSQSTLEQVMLVLLASPL